MWSLVGPGDAAVSPHQEVPNLLNIAGWESGRVKPHHRLNSPPAGGRWRRGLGGAGDRSTGELVAAAYPAGFSTKKLRETRHVDIWPIRNHSKPKKVPKV